MLQTLYENGYECPECDNYWTDVSDGTHDDRCPGCGTSCSPISTRDVEPTEFSGKIRLDTVISIEAAKLLGVPVSWAPYNIAFKYVPTDKGLEIYIRRLNVEHFPDEGWRIYRAAVSNADDISDGYSPLHPVTFHDEGEALCDGGSCV